MLNRLTVSALLKAVIAITSVCVVIALSLTAYESWDRLKTANRIIVELPQGPLFLAARQKLIDELIANGYDPAVDKPLDLDEPLRIKVIGLPFYDSAHYSKKNPKRGHGHGTAKVGTLWELHPFWDIQFIEQP